MLQNDTCTFVQLLFFSVSFLGGERLHLPVVRVSCFILISASRPFLQYYKILNLFILLFTRILKSSWGPAHGGVGLFPAPCIFFSFNLELLLSRPAEGRGIWYGICNFGSSLSFCLTSLFFCYFFLASFSFISTSSCYVASFAHSCHSLLSLTHSLSNAHTQALPGVRTQMCFGLLFSLRLPF